MLSTFDCRVVLCVHSPSLLILHVFRIYSLQLHFSLSLSFMFLCLLLFTIKVSQGKFVSVALPSSSPSHLMADRSKHLSRARSLGVFWAGAACSQPMSSSVCAVCACLPVSVCLSFGRSSGCRGTRRVLPLAVACIPIPRAGCSQIPMPLRQVMPELFSEKPRAPTTVPPRARWKILVYRCSCRTDQGQNVP